jgi:hypothetical protein
MVMIRGIHDIVDAFSDYVNTGSFLLPSSPYY